MRAVVTLLVVCVSLSGSYDEAASSGFLEHVWRRVSGTWGRLTGDTTYQVRRAEETYDVPARARELLSAPEGVYAQPRAINLYDDVERSLGCEGDRQGEQAASTRCKETKLFCADPEYESIEELRKGSEEGGLSGKAQGTGEPGKDARDGEELEKDDRGGFLRICDCFFNWCASSWSKKLGVVVVGSGLFGGTMCFVLGGGVTAVLKLLGIIGLTATEVETTTSGLVLLPATSEVLTAITTSMAGSTLSTVLTPTEFKPVIPTLSSVAPSFSDVGVSTTQGVGETMVIPTPTPTGPPLVCDKPGTNISLWRNRQGCPTTHRWVGGQYYAYVEHDGVCFEGRVTCSGNSDVVYRGTSRSCRCPRPCKIAPSVCGVQCRDVVGQCEHIPFCSGHCVGHRAWYCYTCCYGHCCPDNLHESLAPGAPSARAAELWLRWYGASPGVHTVGGVTASIMGNRTEVAPDGAPCLSPFVK